MGTTRKLRITEIKQAATDLTDTANFANNTQPIVVKVTYTTESTARTFIRLSVHLSHKDVNHTQSHRRHKKGDLIFAKNFRVEATSPPTPPDPVIADLTIPLGKLDYDKAVYVIHVRERDGLAACSRNIARNA